jgi:2-oxoglutarate/2-oxoacid ferredoxin oxidoreductase subunit alpha
VLYSEKGAISHRAVRQISSLHDRITPFVIARAQPKDWRMSSTTTSDQKPQQTPPAFGRQIVNEFSIQVATINGSGSQTANLVLLRSILLMGIPASGKNMFPSNIAGLPTWFTVRASMRGYVARKKEVDVLVAMNPETAREDVLALEAGAAVVYDEPLKLNSLRSDLVWYPVPFDKLVAPICPDAKLRRLVRNMVYDGVLAKLLGIDFGVMERSLNKQLGRKAKALSLNQAALKAGWDYVEANLPKRDPFVINAMPGKRDTILIEGNAAAAIGCMMAGVTVAAWYPITPSSSLCESLITYAKKYRLDPETGKATFAIVQAEDELAALGMVIGASWAGARAMTATSGPGISLMSEFAGLAYYTETPAVVFDIQRVGPSTGLPTRTAQGDLLQVATLSHGDTRHLMLVPSSPSEAYGMAMQAFDLAERFQTPVFVMMDLDLGMNYWMSEPFAYPEGPIDRGKLLTEDVLRRIREWGRYADVDGDGIPYRTIPGDRMPAVLTRGSGHNQKGQYSERPDDYVNNVDRLARKFETARRVLPKPAIDIDPEARVGLVAYGTSEPATAESRDQLREEAGVRTSYLRVRAYPFADEVAAFIDAHERVYVIEQNRDRQLAQLMRMDLEAAQSLKLRSVLHYNGLPIDARSITDSVLAQEGYQVARTVERVAGAGIIGGE